MICGIFETVKDVGAVAGEFRGDVGVRAVDQSDDGDDAGNADDDAQQGQDRTQLVGPEDCSAIFTASLNSIRDLHSYLLRVSAMPYCRRDLPFVLYGMERRFVPRWDTLGMQAAG